MSMPRAVAIVGVAGRFPGASSVEALWANVLARRSAAREVPPARWPVPVEQMIDVAGTPDHARSDRSCTLEPFTLDTTGLALPAELVARLGPLAKLTLQVGADAFRDAKLGGVDPARIGVVLANIALPTDGASKLAEALLLRAVDASMGAGDVKSEPLERYPSALPAGLLARALGLGGGSYTLDAACASSLYALHLACCELEAGRLDAVIAGGVSLPQSLYTQVGFTQLQALSPSGRCAPFDTRADGLVVGEGAGMVVLRRLEDAQREGEKIRAVIRGVGLSNDVGGSLLSPDSEGQLRATRAAYEQAGWTPDEVGLIECHGTGTPRGDAVELQSLTQLWGGRPARGCVLGSVKSNVGHLLTAAGAAGLCKVLSALESKTLPPSANFSAATASAALTASPFRVLEAPEPWAERGPGQPRRAAVSGFGFGGINAHLLLEEAPFSSTARPDSGREVLQKGDLGSAASLAGAGVVAAAPAESRGTLASETFGTGDRDNGAAFSSTPRPDGGRELLQKHATIGQTGVAPRARASSPIAIVGMATHFGRLETLADFQHAIFRGEPVRDARPADRWLGVPGEALPGAWLGELQMPLSRFRIPPREMASLLPQQLLMLKVAAQAFDDARGLGAGPHLRAGAIVGLGLDLDTTSFQLRWLIRERVQKHSMGLSEAQKEKWIAELLESVGPALDATRTLGALGGIVASRLAREFQLGGPSFGVSGEETSGLRALELASRMLQRGETDVMLAGAVDLAGDIRQVLATDAVRPWSRSGTAAPFDARADGPTVGEGAAAVVLKRLDDAIAAGDRIYATVRGFGAAGGTALTNGAARVASQRRAMEAARAEAGVSANEISLIQAHGSGDRKEDRDEADAFAGAPRPTALASTAAIIGQTGAASSLASVISAALSLHEQILPPLPGFRSSDHCLDGLHVPSEAQVWLRDRAEGPRRAGVASMGIEGSCLHAVLEGIEGSRPSSRPLGDRGVALFLVRDDEPRLRAMAAAHRGSIEQLAARWHRESAKGPVTRAIVAATVSELLAERTARETSPIQGQLAFVFPGSGNHYVGMGRSLGAALPEIYRHLDAEVGFLAGQLMPRWVAPWGNDWSAGWEARAAEELAQSPERMILSQVAHGVAVSDAVRMFGVKPDAYLGYSLGESAALFASRTWRDRDQMFARTLASPLFRTELAGECSVARAAWGDAEWTVKVVNRPAEEVRASLAGTAALLIVNAPRECVIGGRKPDVEATVAKLGCEAVGLEGVPTVHLPLVTAVADAYRALHRLPTTPPEGARFYSGAWARAYEPTEENAAESILANAVGGFDFQATVNQAYADGVRVFVELGPQGSCTRMIGKILAGRPHVAVSACVKGVDGFRSVLVALGRLAEAGVPVELGAIYGVEAGISLEAAAPVASLAIPVGGKRGPVPARPRVGRSGGAESHPSTSLGMNGSDEALLATRMVPTGHPESSRGVTPRGPVALRPSTALGTNGPGHLPPPALLAHETFLKLSQSSFALQASALLEQQRLIALLGDAPIREVAFDRAACMEFAVGSLSRMLGPAFSSVDAHPTRVRLPAEPLMLCDRIMSVEGTRGELGPGRCVTEHDVLPNAWYLDGGRAPVCISVEAGQADLFLSAYLGIDLKTRGQHVYRLLDAKIVFHRDLPVAGETIRYDIKIDRFIQQGDTWLFFFRFDGTIDGAPFITMYDGCAGFFSQEQLATGRGIVGEPSAALPARRPHTTPYAPLLPLAPMKLDRAQVEALRTGDLGAAFGAPFTGRTLAPALRLPSGRMQLIDRILELDPAGGRFGLGVVHGEADVKPDDWYLTCHFIDDPVMPGTLMYECCLHTLRVLLLRMGWIAEGDAALHCAPIEAMVSQLRCRGQVTPETKTVSYRVELKEIGYDPEPYVLASAAMYADGRHVVEMEGMSLRIRGLTREKVEASWAQRTVAPKRTLYSKQQVLAYAEGNPSEGFGDRYRVFDRERRIARLPRPPFLFVDRVTQVENEPWVVKPGGWTECDFEVAPDAWYFAANRQRTMPFAVLLEAALQPCGWLAAYVGSALCSDEDLHFRNLDGTATALQEVGPDAGTLTTRARLTKASQAGGMILQEFDFEILRGRERVYAGQTGFGFFPARALAEQVGIRGSKLAEAPADSRSFTLLHEPPVTPDACMGRPRPGSHGLALPAQAFSMIDRIDAFKLDGGPKRLGFISGTKKVDPREWFFAAHFFQDPVMPGSLGLEALIQLLKVYARELFGPAVDSHRFESMALGRAHRWQYRGQVIPTNALVHVQATITELVEGPEPMLVADGLLAVDGRVIYSMKDFTLRLVPEAR